MNAPHDDPNAEPFEEAAALYLAGALEDAERAEFEALLDGGDGESIAALNRMADGIEAIAERITPVSPPPDVRTRLLAMARHDVASPKAKSAIVGDEVVVVPAGDTPWSRTTSRGVWIRRLYSDPVEQTETILLRMEPGSVLKAHPHGEGGEECYLVSGDAFSAGYAMNAGDYQRLPAGLHGPVSTRSGCLLLIRVSSAVQR